MALEVLTLGDIKPEGKRVFLRVDINTPIDPKTGELIEKTRLREAARTISELEGSRLVVGSHQGRPGRRDFVSLERHALGLERILGRQVKFVDDVIGKKTTRAIESLSVGEVLLIENLRFEREEREEFSPELAERTKLVQTLAAHIDVCVLDCFATAHRSSPSIVGFSGLMPTCAGGSMYKELKLLERVQETKREPYIALLGGEKVEDRLEAIANLKVEKLLLSGRVGTLFLEASGRFRGELKLERKERLLETAKRLLAADSERYVLPLDVAVKRNGGRRELDPSEVPRGALAMDIGQKTIDLFSESIRGAGTVLMNGPPGAFEVEGFSLGTESLLGAMASSTGTTIVSGGHLSSALHRIGLEGSIDHVSTAGGALIQYISGKRLPLIDALELASKKWKP